MKIVTEGHTLSFVIVHTNRGEFQLRTGNDYYNDPDEDTDGFDMGRLYMGTSEEGPDEGHTSVHTYCHDEEDAHKKVAGEEEPLNFTHGVAKHPVFFPVVVDNQQGQSHDVQQITNYQVT